MKYALPKILIDQNTFDNVLEVIQKELVSVGTDPRVTYRLRFVHYTHEEYREILTTLQQELLNAKENGQETSKRKPELHAVKRLVFYVINPVNDEEKGMVEMDLPLFTTPYFCTVREILDYLLIPKNLHELVWELCCVAEKPLIRVQKPGFIEGVETTYKDIVDNFRRWIGEASVKEDYTLLQEREDCVYEGQFKVSEPSQQEYCSYDINAYLRLETADACC